MRTPTAGLRPDGRTVTVHVPVALRKRGGRKVVVAPYGAEVGPPDRSAPPDGALVRALARAFRWRKLLETGAYGTIAELAEAEKVSPSYIGRLLRLTLLKPEIVEAVVAGPETQRSAGCRFPQIGMIKQRAY